MVFIVMGVSGCGKSTLGKQLASTCGLDFYDSDDFHSQENIRKMENGIALTDEDRSPWLHLLAEQMVTWNEKGGAVLACSALKADYRKILANKIGRSNIQIIYLKGDYATLKQRLEMRKNHFMGSALLTSQLDTLEEPKDAIVVPIEMSIDEMVSTIVAQIDIPKSLP